MRNVYLADEIDNSFDCFGNLDNSNDYICALVKKREINTNSICTLINNEKGDLELNEATALKEIGKHPNIITLRYSSNPQKPGDRTINIVEAVTGIDLELLLSKDPYYHLTSPADNIISQVAQGLSHIHKQGYVHRDLKPSNIFVEYIEEDPYGELKNRVVKIGDFQNACRTSDIDEKSFPTRGGTDGTDPRLLNSLITGEPSKASERTDVYSTGRIIKRIVSARESSRRREVIYDEEHGTDITIGNKTYPISLVEVDNNGKVKERFPDGIDEKREEKRVRELSKSAPARYKDLIYCCMTPTSKGFNNGQEVAEYVKKRLIRSSVSA